MERRESLGFDLAGLNGASSGLTSSQHWVAWAPHLDAPVPLETSDIAALEGCSPSLWMATQTLAGRTSPDAVRRLLDCGLLLSDAEEHASFRERDRAVRETHWWTPAAVAWSASRWESVDAESGYGDIKTAKDMVDRLGEPPSEVVARVPAEARVPLPRPEGSPLDEVLSKRLTCRNFDKDALLRREDLAAVLHRVFAAHGSHELAPGAVALKKTSPSGGGLHPLEAYLLVRRVQGLAPGLYHYHCVDHALEPLGELDEATLAQHALGFVAGQTWFADAPVQVVMAARFGRHQWKYRNHAKAYRVLHLEAGHFSQTLFLAAAELGLGAFITAAINERQVERAFGLDGLQEGPLAICGFGARAVTMATFELDPARAVWARA